jgi:hypothetical protein
MIKKYDYILILQFQAHTMAYYDTSKPIRQLITQKWFENDALMYKLFISVVTIEEIEKVKNNEKKENLAKLMISHDIKANR